MKTETMATIAQLNCRNCGDPICRERRFAPLCLEPLDLMFLNRI